MAAKSSLGINKGKRAQESLIWQVPKSIKGPANFIFWGNSRACQRTSFYCVNLDAQLDCGFRPHPAFASHVFVTHCHGDHSGTLMHSISRRINPHFYLPKSSVDSAMNMIKAYEHYKLNEPTMDLLPTCRPHGIEIGDKMKLEGKRDIFLEAFFCDHSVPCLGYGFYRKKTKLRAEYVGMEGKEIGKLRKEGKEVNEIVDEPLFVFLGDTTAAIWDVCPNVLKYPLIFVECTFLGTLDGDRERAAKTKHMFWDDLKPIIEKEKNTLFVLIHFSLRYSVSEILDFFQKQNLENVIPWVPSENCVFEENEAEEEA
mmetsp:Transcript_717/g.1041  ORF Transcript_717/g.1041 Transcript_717/m.1041 type:complete len:313 (-) Transcript_717:46-984(-)